MAVSNVFTVSLTKIIKELALTQAYMPASTDEILISSMNVSRPGLELNGFFDYFIVNIGKILNKSHLVAAVFKVTAERIENAKRTRVADMDIVINGGTAGIDFDFARSYGLKLLFFS